MSDAKMADSQRFQWPDYVVFALCLLVSASIGVYYAIQRYRSSKAGVAEYLMGSRGMGVVPVAASLVVSLLSAVTVLGFPAEVYSFGIQIFLFILGYAVSLAIAGIFYLPVYHKLKLTSVYEYLEMRFDRRVRTACSVLSMLVMLLYSAIALYAPSLAISQVTGMSYWSCILLSAILSTFYTILGGFKSVLWTDTLQASIMVVGLLATFAKGAVDAGGMAKVMNISAIGGRLDMTDLVPDFYSRHNVWGWLFGDLFFMLSMYAASQFSAQRFCSVASVNKARLSLLAAVPILGAILSLALCSGLVAFAYYFGCDPLTSGKMDRRDQILPALVMDVFKNHPGMPGLFLTSVLSAALSTLSSVQHSFAAMLLQDGLKPIKENLSGKPFTERQGTVLSQISVLLVGAVIMGLAIAVARMSKMVLQLAISSLAIASGPSLGIFTAGLYVPFANSWGALSGLAVGCFILIWIDTGSVIFKGSSSQPLPVFNHLCPVDNKTSIILNSINNVTDNYMIDNSTVTTEANLILSGSRGLRMYDIPYRYHVFLGTCICFGVCIIVSLVTGGWRQRNKVPKKVLFSWKEHGPHVTWSATKGQDTELKEKCTPVTEPLFKQKLTEDRMNDNTEREDMMYNSKL